ncbi:MAG: hypothetical protein EPO68_13255 [Planctomycetota bacterium]|nr:MAG: hypothetical protein EPO68_13255 [Planctomycetota bacterium]
MVRAGSLALVVLSAVLSSACASDGRVLRYDNGVLAACGAVNEEQRATGTWRYYYADGSPMLLATMREQGGLVGFAIFWERDGRVVTGCTEMKMRCIDLALTMTHTPAWESEIDYYQLEQERALPGKWFLGSLLLVWKGSGTYRNCQLIAPASAREAADAMRAMNAFAAANSRR